MRSLRHGGAQFGANGKRAGSRRTVESRPNVAVVTASEQFWGILRKQMVDAQVSGPLVTDAALASLALEQGATLCSTDRDFRRFRGLKLIDPLETRPA